MRKTIILILLFCFYGARSSFAENVKQQLLTLFCEAEKCYLMDDYQRLWIILNDYYTILDDNWQLFGDSTDVYIAYYNKMRGSYYYGFADNDTDNAHYAEEMYLKSLETFSLRNNTTNSMIIREELAQLYYKMRRYSSAYTQLDIVLNYYNQRCYNMGILSDVPYYYRTLSQIAICNARLGRFDKGISQINEVLKYYKKEDSYDYYEALRKKAKILMLQSNNVKKTNYQDAKKCYEQYVNERCLSIKQLLNTMNSSQREQYWLYTHQFLYDCYRLGNHASEMLYNLALFSKGYLIEYESNNNTPLIKWKQVRNNLEKKECAIEFIQYFGKNDEKRLGCLLLRKTSEKPLFIDLFSTDSLLSLPLANFETVGSAIESPFPEIKDTLYNDTRLSTLIWSTQLMKAIGDATNIYFAPDGIIHQLAIEYLIPDSLITCHRLSSTKKLINRKKSYHLRSALLCGGIDYDTNYHPNVEGNDTIAYRFLVPQTPYINPLPETKNEIDSIYKYRNYRDTILTGTSATDEVFLSMLKGNYNIVHLATHGYFGGRIGIFNDIKPLFNDGSMSKSGVFLAGASYTLTDKNFNEKLFDGILSAEEFSKQNLSQTELIVLSACLTGSGRLTDDGIYGIQRGLKLAGANAIILSLWSVFDYSSSLLMQYFYQELEKQEVKNITKAFLTARHRLSQEEKVIFRYDESTFMIKRNIVKFDKPCYINPFIIIDAI